MTTLRRNLKNTVNNYTDIQCKVREATCNEPWGPASSVMTEIADATHSVVDFSEIMTILWKRVNDHGKNWRHVYKSLVVLDYIVKTGSERVAQQCKENIYSLLTLQDFRFIDKDGKDQGANVREKAKQLVSLLKDEERLKSERKKALQAKERFAQNSMGIGSHTSKMPKSSLNALTRAEYPPRHYPPGATAGPSTDPRVSNAMEAARPTDRDEEQMQLELALAISKEEADKEQQEQEQFKATLERSKTETRLMSINEKQQQQQEAKPTLLSLSQKPPSRPPPPSVSADVDPWGMPVSNTVRSVPEPAPLLANDPWGVPGASSNTTNSEQFGMFGPVAQPLQLTPNLQPTPNLAGPSPPAAAATPNDNLLDDWLMAPAPSSTFPSSAASGSLIGDMQALDPFGIQPTKPVTPPNIPLLTSTSSTTLAPSSKMASILDNRTKHLVNIDNLISRQAPVAGPTNPFAVGGGGAPTSVFSPQATNPFLAGTSNNSTEPAPSLNQLRGANSPTTNPFC